MQYDASNPKLLQNHAYFKHLSAKYFFLTQDLWHGLLNKR
jgi:hypothetical protein